MKKAKKADEKNSLEQLLLKGKKAYEGNKTKTYQYILIIVAIIVVFALVRSKFMGASSKYDAADAAYYSATQTSFSGQGAADGELLKGAAASYKNTLAGDVLNADAGDAYLAAGQADVVAKQAYSRGVKSSDGEVKTPADPTVNFTAAYDAYMVAANSSDAQVRARAYYGAAVAQESLASVAADDAVEPAVEKAKEAYKKVCENESSPYYAPAVKALANLERALTVDYYKSVAKKFTTLPEPSDESILSENNDELKPGEEVKVSDFETNDDSAESEENVDAEKSEEVAPAEAE